MGKPTLSPTRPKTFNETPPYAQWHINDTYADPDFRELSSAAQGLYFAMVHAIWNSKRNSLPADPDTILTILGKRSRDMPALEELLRICDHVGDRVTLNYWHASKQDSWERMQQNRRNGRVGAAKRWKKDLPPPPPSQGQ